jgi:hypothetical protein
MNFNVFCLLVKLACTHNPSEVLRPIFGGDVRYLT